MTDQKKHRVMLVEDEDSNRNIIRSVIERANYDVEDYAHGIAAHRRLSELHALGQEKHYNLIISDIDMPEMDGIAFAREAGILAPEVPFVLMTGKPRTSYPANVKYVLDKPFSGAELRKVIAQYLKSH